MINFYTAGKIWHAPKFQNLRDVLGMPVRARWIDLENDSDFVENQKDELWKQCYEDIRDSNFVLLYNEDFAEEQRGALVEVGMAYGLGKSVYVVGKSKSIAPNKISDVAFTHYHGWTWLDTTDLVRGANLAMAFEMRKNLNKLKLKHA